MGIVQDEKMSGEPRLEGRRITVYQAWTMGDEYDDPGEIAEQLRIDEEEVETALEYGRTHTEDMEKLAEEREGFAEEFQGSDVPNDVGE